MTILGVLELVDLRAPSVDDDPVGQRAGSADGSTDLATPGQRWEITGRTVIGRVAAADVTIALPVLSRRHLELVEITGRVGACDLGSRNGSSINGLPLGPDPVLLADGDELVLAGSVALRFIDPMATPIGPRLGRLRGIWIDPQTEAVWLDARPVDPPLSPRQLALLRLLDEADGQPVSRQQIVEVVWADVAASGVSDEAVSALVKRLRQRLAQLGRQDLIEMVRHRGLRLVNDD